MQIRTTIQREPTAHIRSRVVLTLPETVAQGIAELAEAHFRSFKGEALRILSEGVERERAHR